MNAFNVYLTIQSVRHGDCHEQKHRVTAETPEEALRLALEDLKPWSDGKQVLRVLQLQVWECFEGHHEALRIHSRLEGIRQ